MNRRVSIVVLTYNRCDEVCRTLERLRALPDRCRIVVVDNASSDGTTRTLRRAFPDVALVRAPRNLGAAGRNLGVERVTTPYVAFCDDDTGWLPGALDQAADILDSHPGIAVVNARIQVGDGAALDPACAAMARSPLPAVAGVGPEITGFMAGASVMRTRAYRRAGGYWAPLFIGGEESLLALDIQAQGGCIVYAASVRTCHWPSQARDSALRRRMLARNALWTAWLRLPLGMAMARSASVLRALPGWRERLQACRDARTGWRLVKAGRQPLESSVCRKLARVWEAERGTPPRCPRA